MSHTDKELQPHEFRFGEQALTIVCRRLPDEVSRVTQTLQLDVEELFANLLDWDTTPAPAKPPPQPEPETAAVAAAAGPTPAADDAKPDSKRLCGNVASDQPDLIGLDVWPASIALCRYLSSHPGLVAGAAVCELGAGTGLPGMLCAKLAARHVLLTDYEPLVVDRMRSNAQLNGLQGVCAFQALDWLDLSTLAPAQRRAHDLLLLADVIYAAAVVRPLVDTLLALLQPGTGVALVAHRIRRPLIFDRVEKIAKLQERDEIFEEFKAACQQSGLRLRFLNGDSPAAQAGDEPLLLVIGGHEDALLRFPLAEDGEAPAAAAGQAAASGGSQGAGGGLP